jgi:hypothetical protein
MQHHFKEEKKGKTNKRQASTFDQMTKQEREKNMKLTFHLQPNKNKR